MCHGVRHVIALQYSLRCRRQWLRHNVCNQNILPKGKDNFKPSGVDLDQNYEKTVVEIKCPKTGDISARHFLFHANSQPIRMYLFDEINALQVSKNTAWLCSTNYTYLHVSSEDLGARSRALIQYKKMSCQYRKSHCGDKTILRPSYLHNGISYTGKTFLYWIRAQVSREMTSNYILLILLVIDLDTGFRHTNPYISSFASM